MAFPKTQLAVVPQWVVVIALVFQELILSLVRVMLLVGMSAATLLEHLMGHDNTVKRFRYINTWFQISDNLYYVNHNQS